MRKLVLYFLVGLVFLNACAQKPEDQVAVNEDLNLIAKSQLLGKAVANLTTDSLQLSGVSRKIGALDAKVKDRLKKLELQASEDVSFIISRNYLTVVESVNGIKTPTKMLAITGHYDLESQQQADGSKIKFLVRNTTKEESWQKRAYVEVDPDTVYEIKASDEILKGLYTKANLGKGILTWEALKGSGFLSSQQTLIAKVESNNVTNVTDKTTIDIEVTKNFFNIIANGQIILQASVNHVDLKQAESMLGEKLPNLVTNTVDKPWFKRSHLKIDMDNAEAVRFSSRIKTPDQVLSKSVSGQCFVSVAELPKGIKRIVSSSLPEIVNASNICLDISQSYLSISAEGEFVANVSINHVDVKQETSTDGLETLIEVVASEEDPNWANRSHIQLNLESVNKLVSNVGENYLKKSDFTGEFIYSAVISAAHSENSLGFKGLSISSGSRLKFVFGDNELTAVKSEDLLNPVGLPAPVLRYQASFFDIERSKNSLGDQTHFMIESQDKLPENREFLRANFSANEIVGYFNDIFGIEKLVRFNNVTARSVMVGDVVKKSNGSIEYVTEEVFTPSYTRGNLGVGETILQPVSVRVKHTFIPVGGSSYKAREYSDVEFSKFGFFTTTKLALDENGIATDDTKTNLINRFDLANGKKIVYYYSENLPQKFLAATKKSVEVWNKSFAVITGAADTIILKSGKGLDPYDPSLNFIVYDEQSYARSPLGYGPSLKDPKTGEIISAKAYIYADGFKFVRRVAADYYDLIVAGKTPEQFHSDKVFSSETDVGDSLRQNVQIASMAKAGAKATNTANTTEVASRFTAAKIEHMDSIHQLMTQRHLENSSAHEHIAGQCILYAEDSELGAIDFVRASVQKGLSKEEMIDKIEELAYLTTLSHELGHTFGLRHNFKGSIDEKNFPTKYHELKKQPETGDYKDYYATASVMDYNQNFAGVASSVGSYDHAAILYGYGDKLEQVAEDGAISLVDGQAIRDTMTSVQKQNPGVSSNQVMAALTAQLNLKSYEFCTDGNVTEDVFCNRFDLGSDLATITSDLAGQYGLNYILYSARRGRRTFTGGSTAVMSRYIMPMRQLLDDYVYQIVTNGFKASGAGSQQDYIASLNTVIGFYNSILQTMAPGTYQENPETKFYERVEGNASQGSDQVLIPLGFGKHFQTQYENDGFTERAIARGVQFDKLAVLFAMSLRGFPAQKYRRASLNLNFFDLVGELSFGIFSNVLRDELTGELEVVKPSADAPFIPSQLVSAPEGSQTKTIKFKPDTNLSIQQFASVFLTQNFNTNSDDSFGSYVDYRVKGENDSGLNTSKGVVEFDSVTGLETYVVAQTKDKRSISFEIATKASEVSKEISELEESLEEESDEEKIAEIEGQIRSKEFELKRHESQLKFMFNLNSTLNE